MNTPILHPCASDVQPSSTAAPADADIQEALDYAEALTGSREHPLTLVSIGPGDRTEARRGTVADLWGWVTARQREGWGIFATVNATNGAKRTKRDITRIRALWIDADMSADRYRDDFPMDPHFIVESSPGKFHYYWRVEDDRADLAEQVMESMIAAHPGGDKGAKDVSRVLRLPGTLHLKGAPFMSRIVFRRDGPPCHLDQMRTSWPEASSDDVLPMRKSLDIAAALGTIAGCAPGVHDALRGLSAHLAYRGVAPELSEALLTGYTQHYSDGSPRMDERIQQIPGLVSTGAAKFQAPETFDTSDPLDLFTTADGAHMAFKPEHYPAIIGTMAQDIAHRVGCDPLIPAWTALTACAGLLPDRMTIQPKAHDTTWCEAPRLWVAFIGDPSAKKTPGMAAVLGPIKRLQSRLADDYAAMMARWRDECASARRARAAEPEAPAMRRVMINDATVESVALILNANPEGVLSEQDELSGWFGSHDAYRPVGTGKDRAFWLQAYNGGAHVVDRVKGSIHVPHLSVSIVGGIQPGPMREIAGKIGDDGLLQRFIPIPIRAAVPGADVPPDAAALAAWADLVEQMHDMRSGWYQVPERCRLTPGAQDAVTEAMRRTGALASDPTIDRRLCSALAKGDGQLSRLILIFHAIEGRDDLMGFINAEISEATARRAIAVYFELVAVAQSQFYTSVIGESVAQQRARRVAGYVLAKEREDITDRDLYREALKEADERERADAMRILELAGWVTPAGEHRGRVNRWVVNQRVHQKFSARAAAERARRAGVVARIRGQ